jgi:hypothetical protein
LRICYFPRNIEDAPKMQGANFGQLYKSRRIKTTRHNTGRSPANSVKRHDAAEALGGRF